MRTSTRWLHDPQSPRRSGSEAAQAIADAGRVMTHRQILLVLVRLMAGMFLSALNQTVVGTSMKTIADDLDGLALQAWVIAAFLIGSTGHHVPLLLVAEQGREWGWNSAAA